MTNEERKLRHKEIKGLQLFVIFRVQGSVNPAETGVHMKMNLINSDV